MGLLLRLIEPADVRIVAVVGTAKNAGKTTSLNRMVREGTGALDPMGLLSIGVDGEEADFWLGVPKPRISVRPGTLVATAEDALHAATARVTVCHRVGVRTSLGELIIGRVETPGAVLLAGVRHRADARLAVEAMSTLGARKILIDGSYQRMMAADPSLSHGVVLATGAVLGRSVEEVVDRTIEIVARLSLTVSDGPGEAALLEAATAEGKPLIRTTDGSMTLVAVPGPLSDGFLESLIGQNDTRFRVLLSDATRCFAGAGALARFIDAGHQVHVARPIRILAITVNPTSVTGPDLPKQALVDGIQAHVGGIPVLAFDPEPG